jgi:hypothetical protein
MCKVENMRANLQLEIKIRVTMKITLLKGMVSPYFYNFGVVFKN